MAYQDTLTLTAGANDLLVLNSAAGVPYEPQPDARLVNIKVSGATFKNFTVSSGGTVYYSSAGNTLSGFHIYSGGLVSGAKLSFNARDTVVHSGGQLYFVYGGSASNVTIESGAYVSGLFTNAFKVVGSNWQIASGATIVNGNQTRYDVFTDARGAIHNAAIAGAAHFSGVLLVDAKVSAGLLYMSNGTIVSGGVASTGGIAIQNGYLYNGNVYNTGKIWTQTTNAKISLGGAETRITFRAVQVSAIPGLHSLFLL